MRKNLVFAVIISFFIFGCDKIESIEKKTNTLDADLQDIKTKILIIEKDIDMLRAYTAENSAEIYRLASESTLVNIGGDGFSIINSNIGKITVSCNNIIEYGSGSKAKLTFGNTTNAVLTGISIRLEYGKKYTQGNDYAEWRKNILIKNIRITDNFNPGMWNDVLVSLPECKPSELTHLNISLACDGIELKKSRN